MEGGPLITENLTPNAHGPPFILLDYPFAGPYLTIGNVNLRDNNVMFIRRLG